MNVGFNHWPLIKMSLVKTLFTPLEDLDIDYCLLRNYEFLEDAEIGNDIDVLISREQRSRADTVLNDLGFVNCGNEPTLHTYYIRLRPDKRKRQIVHVCWGDVMYCTLPIVDGQRLLESRVRHPSQPVWIPSQEDKFVQLVFHSVLNRGFFKEKYIDELLELSEVVDESVVRDHVDELYGKVGQKTINLALEANFDATLGLKWRLVLSNAVRRPHRIPRFLYVLFVYYQISRNISRFNRSHNPLSPVPVIALLGPDGAGKSTLAELLNDDLEEMGIDSEVRELGVYNDHTRPLRLLQKVNNSLSKFVYNPFNNYDRQSVKSARGRGALELDSRNRTAKSVLYFADQIWRYLKANSSGRQIIIADRYIHDVLLYHRDGIFDSLLRLFEGDHVKLFLLTTDSDVIAERSEYDRESIDEMQERLSKLPHERTDVSRSPEEIREELLERIAKSDFPKYLK